MLKKLICKWLIWALEFLDEKPKILGKLPDIPQNFIPYLPVSKLAAKEVSIYVETLRDIPPLIADRLLLEEVAKVLHENGCIKVSSQDDGLPEGLLRNHCRYEATVWIVPYV